MRKMKMASVNRLNSSYALTPSPNIKNSQGIHRICWNKVKHIHTQKTNYFSGFIFWAAFNI